MFAYKPFIMNSFHGISSGNPHPFSLKLKFGKASSLPIEEIIVWAFLSTARRECSIIEQIFTGYLKKQRK
jgi:hypothetical protein